MYPASTNRSFTHYNWHRHYDPTLGRYTQPAPLGFVDGPSVYAYARSAPLRCVDKDRRDVVLPPSVVPWCLSTPLNSPFARQSL
ncbi:MAG: RHS repeat-associated core domain-containing protein [Hyphomicrobium sp.]